MRRFVSPVQPKTQEPSITSAVKSMANVLLGPTGQTPIDNIIQMQHFQLWGFLLVVAALLFIVWLMQKKLDAIDKQYKEQFVLLHRLFKSHQDLQVDVRKKQIIKNESGSLPASTTTQTTPSTSQISSQTPPLQTPPLQTTRTFEQSNLILYEEESVDDNVDESENYEEEENENENEDENENEEVGIEPEPSYEIFE